MIDVDELRSDFPFFDLHGDSLVYLDSACQTLRPRQVIEAVTDYYSRMPACGGRSVHRLATDVTMMVDETRERVADFFGVNDSEIVFTKNCTEAINLVAKGFPFEKGDTVLTTDIEHNSNHIPWIQVSRSKGVKRCFVQTSRDGVLDIEDLKEKMNREVELISVIHTSNVTGTTMPVGAIVEIARDYGARVMVDGAQAAPHQEVDLRALDVDYYALSMHKMLGPSGVGVLYGKEECLTDLEPLVSGGGTVNTTTYDDIDYLSLPERLEGGLMNYAGIAGTRAAVDYVESVGIENIEEHERDLNSFVTRSLRDVEEVSLIGPASPELRSSVFSFNIDGMRSTDVAVVLDEIGGVMIRSGMHCAHPFFEKISVPGCARASFYVYNTRQDCERMVDSILELIDEHRQ